MSDQYRATQPAFSDETGRDFTRLPDERIPPLTKQITDDVARDIGKPVVTTDPINEQG